MIIAYGNKRYEELREELDLYNDMGISPVKKLAGSLSCVNDALSDLKNYVSLNGFKDQEEEIHFFKYIKPKFCAWLTYAPEVYTIEAGKPLADEQAVKDYYEQELKYPKRFFFQNRFLYQYYQLDASDMDTQFFIRGVHFKSLLIPQNQITDPNFSTACDDLFSKFIAYEMVQEFLVSAKSTSGETEHLFKHSKKGRPLKWTGDKSNLVELAYGLYGTLQINEGKVDISDIIDWMEQSLQVNLSRYYRRFTEIKMRKTVSKTRFLDEMTAALMHHIDTGDMHRPN